MQARHFVPQPYDASSKNETALSASFSGIGHRSSPGKIGKVHSPQNPRPPHRPSLEISVIFGSETFSGTLKSDQKSVPAASAQLLNVYSEVLIHSCDFRPLLSPCLSFTLYGHDSPDKDPQFMPQEHAL